MVHLRARGPGEGSAENHVRFMGVKAQTQEESSKVFVSIPYILTPSGIPLSPLGAKLRNRGICVG